MPYPSVQAEGLYQSKNNAFRCSGMETNKLLGIRKEVIANLREVQSDIGDTEGLKKEIARLENERNVAAELVQQLIDG